MRINLYLHSGIRVLFFLTTSAPVLSASTGGTSPSIIKGGIARSENVSGKNNWQLAKMRLSLFLLLATVVVIVSAASPTKKGSAKAKPSAPAVGKKTTKPNAPSTGSKKKASRYRKLLNTFHT